MRAWLAAMGVVLGCGGLWGGEGPRVVVVTQLAGADAETVDHLVAQPLTVALMPVPGVDRVESLADEDGATVTVRFERGVDAWEARSRVADALATASLQDAIPMLAAPGRDVAVIAAPEDVGMRLLAVRGVSGVQVHGERRRRTVVEIDPSRLAAFGLRADDVLNALGSQNTHVAGGMIDARSVVIVRAVDTAEDLGAVVLRDGVRLSDVATIRVDVQTDDGAWLDGEPTTLLVVQGEDVVELPPDVQVLPEPDVQLRAWAPEAWRHQDRLPRGEVTWVVASEHELRAWATGDVAAAWRAYLAETPGITGLVQGPGDAITSLVVVGDGCDAAADRIAAAARSTPGVRGVMAWPAPARPMVKVRLDPERSAAAGVSTADVAEAVRLSQAGVEVLRIDDMPVVVRFPEDLDAVLVDGYPLARLASIEVVATSPVARFDLLRGVRVDLDVEPGREGAVLDALRAIELPMGVVLTAEVQ